MTETSSPDNAPESKVLFSPISEFFASISKIFFDGSIKNVTWLNLSEKILETFKEEIKSCFKTTAAVVEFLGIICL